MKPTVALTFDDGPSVWTSTLLKVLGRHDAKATFFVLGENIRGHEDMIQFAHHHGHEFGVHGWDHSRLEDEENEEAIRGIARTALYLTELTETPPRYWRAPWHQAPDWAIDAAKDIGLELLPVTLDGYDVARDETMILPDLMDGLQHGAIIGLHDGIARNGSQRMQTRRPTIKAVDRLLAHCRSVTASELDRLLCS